MCREKLENWEISEIFHGREIQMSSEFDLAEPLNTIFPDSKINFFCQIKMLKSFFQLHKTYEKFFEVMKKILKN